MKDGWFWCLFFQLTAQLRLLVKTTLNSDTWRQNVQLQTDVLLVIRDNKALYNLINIYFTIKRVSQRGLTDTQCLINLRSFNSLHLTPSNSVFDASLGSVSVISILPSSSSSSSPSFSISPGVSKWRRKWGNFQANILPVLPPWR